MAIVRVNRNLEAELTGSLNQNGPLEHVLGEVADDIVGHARGIARAEFYRRGGYLTGLKAEHGINEHGELVGRAVATDWKSHWGEWPPRQERGNGRRGHILTRAAERAGFAVVAGGLAGGVRPRVGARALPSSGRAAIGGR